MSRSSACPTSSPGPWAWAGRASSLLHLFPLLIADLSITGGALLSFLLLPLLFTLSSSLSCSFCLLSPLTPYIFRPPTEANGGPWPETGLRKRALYRAVSPRHPRLSVRTPPLRRTQQLFQLLSACGGGQISRNLGCGDVGVACSLPGDPVLGSGQVTSPVPSPLVPGTRAVALGSSQATLSSSHHPCPALCGLCPGQSQARATRQMSKGYFPSQ